MGAPAAAFEPRRSRKPVEPPAIDAELNKRREDLRNQFRQRSGYGPLEHAWLPELWRLVTTGPEWFLVTYALSRSLGRERAKGEPAPELTLAESVENLALLSGYNVRTIQRAIERLDRDGILHVERPSDGVVILRLLFRNWRELPDYQPEPQPKKPPASDDEMHTAEDAPKPLNTETRRLTPKPVLVRPGQKPRPVQIDCGVKTLRWEIEAESAMIYSVAVEPGGDMVLVGSLGEKQQRPEHSLKTHRTNGHNNLTPLKRQICRAEDPRVPALRTGLEALGFDLPDALVVRLVSLLPRGCTPEVACRVVQDRLNRGPVDHHLLEHRVFGETIPQVWKQPRFQKPQSNGAKLHPKDQRELEKLERTVRLMDWSKSS